MVMKRLLEKIGRRLAPVPSLPESARISFSQCGEDLIMDHLLRRVLGIPMPRFIDIGSGDPRKLNNTFYFNRRGCRGVCVEPNPLHAAAIREVRPTDICVEAGVVPSADQPRLTFYLFEPPTLSTFSFDERTRLERHPDYRFVREQVVDVLTLTGLFAIHGVPNLLSLDLEGIDDAVLRHTDWIEHRPAVICAETVDHWDERKNDELIAWMESQNYTVYADTFINTIFVATEHWRARRRACDA